MKVRLLKSNPFVGEDPAFQNFNFDTILEAKYSPKGATFLGDPDPWDPKWTYNFKNSCIEWVKESEEVITEEGSTERT